MVWKGASEHAGGPWAGNKEITMPFTGWAMVWTPVSFTEMESLGGGALPRRVDLSDHMSPSTECVYENIRSSCVRDSLEVKTTQMSISR